MLREACQARQHGQSQFERESVPSAAARIRAAVQRGEALERDTELAEWIRLTDLKAVGFSAQVEAKLSSGGRNGEGRGEVLESGATMTPERCSHMDCVEKALTEAHAVIGDLEQKLSSQFITHEWCDKLYDSANEKIWSIEHLSLDQIDEFREAISNLYWAACGRIDERGPTISFPGRTLTSPLDAGERSKRLALKRK
ncbi:hypothetical protein AMST5_01326 [freshwater sediment metagenome]|uniref:Uncharacterized protein n=1 Tax=freshwater sediment metagenome TaxID=556182 RepID=A0AA48LY79_9ZZZZ